VCSARFDARNQNFQLGPRPAQPRRNGSRPDVERFGDFGHREPFDFEQDQHGGQIRIHLCEQAIEQRSSATAIDEVVRKR
jgi:hypothetical protein